MAQSPMLATLGETADHWSRLAPLLREGSVLGAGVHDARVAALCLAHGITRLWSADRDFSRFPALNLVNPLV